MAGVGNTGGKGTTETTRVETDAERAAREEAASRREKTGAVIPERRPEERPVNIRDAGTVFSQADVERALVYLREKGGEARYTGDLEFVRIKEGPQEVVKGHTITRPNWLVRAVEWFKGIFPGFGR